MTRSLSHILVYLTPPESYTSQVCCYPFRSPTCHFHTFHYHTFLVKNSNIVSLLSMVFACEACGSSFKYYSDRGLRQHQLNCEEFLQADNEASTVDDALEKYRRKLQRKKRKVALREVSLTGSGVREAFIFYLNTHNPL